MTTKAELADRYGAPSPVRRTVIVVVIAVVAVVALGWLAWAAFFHSTPGAESRIVGFEVVDKHTTEANVQVDLRDADEAECVVRAISVDKTIVGELAFTGTDGQQIVTIRTEREATAVEMVGCRAEGQSRWR